MATKRLITMLFCTLMILIPTQLITNAQDEPPAPQFLYRIENHLILLDGYTGKTSVLPFEVNEKDYFEWSPDGKYLVAQLNDGENIGFCLNLYDMDNQKWVNDKPISCAVKEVVLSESTLQVFYSTSDKTNGALWEYSLKDKSNHEVYRTTKGNELNPDGISGLKSSPSRKHLTFQTYHEIMGGTLNSLIILNIETEKYSSISAPNTYYADYNPVWSADDRWFLITLKEEYVTSGVLPKTNHLGDVYLVSSETGKQYRLTYTPAADEQDIHWTENGQIAFTEVTEQKFTYTVDQAMTIEAVPPDQIATPEPVDYASISYNPVRVSPDPNIGAWVKQTQQPESTYIFELVIGYLPTTLSEGRFSVPISDPNQSTTVLIGWRPSNYPYSGG